MPHRLLLILLFACSLAHTTEAPGTGPLVPDFGPVILPPSGAYNLDRDTLYRVSLDVSRSEESPDARNSGLESAARFLNMHAQTGIPADHMEFALVVHGAATKDLLSEAAYRSRFGRPNPNAELIHALRKAGVRIYVCSQSASFSGMQPEEFDPAITMAVSAMTAHVQLQREGFSPIPF